MVRLLLHIDWHPVPILVIIYEILLVQVYVIGSSSKLGQWKVQNGIKLSYAGDSIWHGDCILQHTDFPLKYPEVSFFFQLEYLSMNMFLSSLVISLSLYSSLTTVSRTNIVNLEKMELFLPNLDKTGTFSLMLQIFHQDILYFQMACCE